jgi:hypothetical protein
MDRVGSVFCARSAGRPSRHALGSNRWGTGHLVITAATGLDPAVPHTVEIVPAFEDGKDQEVRLESVCVAGGAGMVEIIR